MAVTSKQRILAACSGAAADRSSSTSFASIPRGELARQVQEAMEVLAPTGRFILHPVDALHPDTPWEETAAVIEAWKECWQ
jgi:hypothetical protein